MIHKSAVTKFCAEAYMPEIDKSAFIHPLAAVIGHVKFGKRVMVAPFASIRGDEGRPIFVDDDSNVQDGVVIHGLVTENQGQPIRNNQVEVAGHKFSVYVGKRVSLAHQAQIHGPAFVGDHTFVGMKSLVFKATVGSGCVIEPGCIVMGVSIGNGRFVPAGTVVRDQVAANALPGIAHDYPLKDLNEAVVRINMQLADGYRSMAFG